VKILIVDDHELIRSAMKPVLAQLGEAAAAEVLDAPTFPRALEILAAHPEIDLVVLDFNLPGVSGYAALVDLQERHPDIPVVIMSGEDDPAIVREAFERGALGFIPKSSSTPVIVNALRLVLSGGTYVPAAVMQARAAAPVQAKALPGGTDNAKKLGLTPRQLEVLWLVLAGKSNKLICRELDLAEGTVKIHVAAVLKSLGAANRVEAVIAAARLGIRA
jgi:DNA-binding NarL/FixJ family response regulator